MPAYTSETRFPIPNETAPKLTITLNVYNCQLVEAAKTAVGDAEAAFSTMHDLEDWKGALDNIEWVIGLMHPYTKIAWSAVTSITQALSQQLQRDENIKKLIESLRSSFDLVQSEDLLKAITPNSNQALILKVMLRHIGLCSEFIQHYTEDKQFATRLARNLFRGISKEVQDLCNTLASLRQDLLDNALISTQITVDKIQRNMDIIPKRLADFDIDSKLAELPYKSGWRSIYSVERSGCHPGTRVDLLEYVTRWVDDPSSKPGLALFGQAGTGKSTVAHELALRFQLCDRLASYYSFSRSDKSKHEDHSLLTTIIHDLCKRYPSFKAAVGERIKVDISLRTTNSLDLLFDSLLMDAMWEVNAEYPILIVIDGLDESANPLGKTGLAAFLARFLGSLPSYFRIFMTSRLDGNIRQLLANAQTGACEALDINDHRLTTTDDDIRRYFQDPENLTPRLYQQYGDVLVEKSEGLFQWASVACRHIKEPPPGWTESDCLRGLLNPITRESKEYKHELNRPLYALYDSVLSGYFSTEIARRRFRSVIGHLLVAPVPFSVKSLTSLRQFSSSPDQDDPDSVLAIVKHLGSLLSNVASSEYHDLPIVPLHTSFRDFLTHGITANNPFFINLNSSHRELIYACLNVMLRELRFNIFGVSTSYFANTEIMDHAQIGTRISPALFYACRYWYKHLKRLPFDDFIFKQVQSFLQEKFLFWLEVLSIADKLPLAMQAFVMLRRWIASNSGVNTASNQFNELATDAFKFLRYFATPISRSVAHIYLSALPFTPTSSKIYQIYASQFSNTVALEFGRQTDWPALELSINTQSTVYSVAFSRDGHYIVTGASNSTICRWDTTTGRMVGEPLTRHTGPVNTLKLSPDGQLMASGSGDGTICIWNASSWELERGPLQGHTQDVYSVEFSPDGQWLISGSEDATILIWNVTTGAIHQGPFTGHSKCINSVTFSPDGATIASASSDHEVRVWSASNGELKQTPFTGHTREVMSVKFSPDGQYIVSGSKDRTVIVWNVSTGLKEQGPLIGHIYDVTCVGFSSDGTRIITSSYDNTVRIWNRKTGRLEHILHGHVNWIYCHALSPDGQRIGSGSEDRTFCIWTIPGTELGFGNEGRALASSENNTVTRHTDTVRCVAFSPDGKHIVSGSDDRTICIWNASTGRLESGPIKHHTSTVFSAVFSPDGEWIATGSGDRSILLINPFTGERKGYQEPGSANASSSENLPFTGHTAYIRSVSFSPDGLRLASGSHDQTIRVWNVNTGELELGPLIGHNDKVVSVQFSPNGAIIASGSWDATVRLWDSLTGELIKEPLKGHKGGVTSIAFSPDGTQIVSGSSDRTLCVWNVSTGILERGPLAGHTSFIASVTFSPDGSQFASGSDDLTIRVWNALTGTLAYVLPTGHTDIIHSIAFSPDGTRIASGGQDSTIRIMPACAISPTGTESHLNNSSVIDPDGWIRGEHNELVLWVPSLHRAGFYRPSFPSLIIGENQFRFDTSKFVHGENWTACYTGHHI
ncbi:Vegetative incompatibility protein HET-E-1 [Psilocybe cubensis]|nr:Vegetative incompatibility protein HET-E-1 [Psilocybe cubensis]KAH9480194.1 Vegetative incompatibility protein HET-E-1 [Psilocybe cubensis]